MLKNVLVFMPLIAATILVGCTDSEVQSDEEFLETIRAEAEKAPDTEFQSGSALEAGARVPRIALEVDHVVIRDVPHDGTGEGRVKIFNKGEGTLRISGVSTSCSCTVGRVDNKVVPPGGETDLIITIYPDKIPGFDATRMLTISSNDPNDFKVGLPVSSIVKPELEIVPDNWNLGAIQAGKGHERHFIVRQLIDEPVTITSARTTHEHIEATYDLRPEDQWAKPGYREYDLVLHIKPDAPVGRLDARLALKSDLKRTERLMFDLSGVVHRAPYTMIPRNGTFSNVTPGTTIEDVFALIADEPITTDTIEADADVLELSYRQGETPNEVIFDMTVPPDAPAMVQQTWTVQFELGGKSYTEQFLAHVKTTADVPESD